MHISNTVIFTSMFEFLSAIAAIFAGLAWRAAAEKPVPKYAGAGYGGRSRYLSINAEIERAAALNRIAAMCASIAAMLQAIALLVPVSVHIWEHCFGQ